MRKTQWPASGRRVPSHRPRWSEWSDFCGGDGYRKSWGLRTDYSGCRFAPNAEPNTVLDLHTAPIAMWIWCRNFLDTGAGRNQNVTCPRHFLTSAEFTRRAAVRFVGGRFINVRPALGHGLQWLSIS